MLHSLERTDSRLENFSSSTKICYYDTDCSDVLTGLEIKETENSHSKVDSLWGW